MKKDYTLGRLLLKILTPRLMLVLMLAFVIVFVAACSSQGGNPSPPSGPIGGGCG